MGDKKTGDPEKSRFLPRKDVEELESLNLLGVKVPDPLMGCDEVAKGIIESPSKTDEEQKREYRGKNIVAHPPLKKDDRSEPEKKMKSVVPAG